jgi:oligoendopeptidase F
MLDTATDVQERTFLLGTWLDGMRGTLFRQTMFAQFELDIHERTERGEPLTGERLSEIYLDLLRTWHGHDDGVMVIDDDCAIEWAAVPHFYYDFYVYQYATGVVAAMALAERLLQEGQPAAARYHAFLESGGSDHPLVLLRRAGVDLETAEPYDAALTAIDRRIDDLESLLAIS